MSEAFARARKLAENAKATTEAQAMQSRALAGWGDQVRPYRAQRSYVGRPPMNRATIAGGIKARPVQNLVGTVTPARGATRQV